MENSGPPLPPPPSPLPRPRAQKSGGASGPTVVLVILGCVVGLFLALGIPAFNRVRQQARSDAVKQRSAQPPVPLTAEEMAKVRRFGEVLARAIQENKSAAVKAMHDFEAMADRILVDTDLPSSFRKGVMEGTSGNAGGVFKEVMGKECRLNRVTHRDGHIALTLRITFEEGGVNYLDALIEPSGGSFKIVDVYTYIFGNMGSRDSREAIALMTKQDAAGLDKLLNMRDMDLKKTELMTGLFTSFSQHRFAEFIKSYDSLPQDMKSARTLFRMYLQSLQMLGSPTPKQQADYLKALEKAPSIFGKETSIALLRIDPLFEKKDYKGVITCLNEVIAAVGEDAYLTRLLVNSAILDKDLAVAETNLTLAEKQEPDAVGMVDLRLQVRALKKDFVGVVQELERFTKAGKGQIKPEMLTEDVYVDFLASPEGKAWAAGLEK